MTSDGRRLDEGGEEPCLAHLFHEPDRLTERVAELEAELASEPDAR